MFRKKNKYRIISEKWEDIFTIKLDVKPNIGEWIYHEKKYHQITQIIHQNNIETILVVKEIENEKN